MKKTELKATSYGKLLQEKRATALKEEDAVSTPQENSGEEIETDPLLPEKAKSVTYAKPVIQDDDDLDKERDDMEEEEEEDMEEDEEPDEDLDEIGDTEEYEDEEDDEEDDEDRDNDEDKNEDADRDQDEGTDRYYAHDFTEENEYVDELYGDSYVTHIHSNRM